MVSEFINELEFSIIPPTRVTQIASYKVVFTYDTRTPYGSFCERKHVLLIPAGVCGSDDVEKLAISLTDGVFENARDFVVSIATEQVHTIENGRPLNPTIRIVGDGE